MKFYAFLLTSLALILCGPAIARDDRESANPAEVIARVQDAASLLAAQGTTGFDVLRDPKSEFMWKDTYVFVVNCDADEVMANPAFPERQGGDIKQHTDYNGYHYGRDLCALATKPQGGWIEYTWPRPGGGEPSRKISYVTSVEGLPYQLGAGIYNETVSLDALNRLIPPGN